MLRDGLQTGISRSRTALAPAKNDTLRFCGLVFALEVIQSTTALDKLIVLFPHLTLFTGEEVPGQYVARRPISGLAQRDAEGREG